MAVVGSDAIVDAFSVLSDRGSLLCIVCLGFPQLGTYHPIPSKDGVKELQVNTDRVKYWLSVGAQPSDRVKWLFGKLNILPPPPYRVRTKSALPKKTEEAST
jgi:ribosomal protein S16